MKNMKNITIFKNIKVIYVIAAILFFPPVSTFAQAISSETNNDTESKEKIIEPIIEKTEVEKHRETIEYGLDSEVEELIDTLIETEDDQFTDLLVTLFNSTSNRDVREKIITYCTHYKDASLKDYSVALLEDPYDEEKQTVSLVCKYVEELKITEAAPFLQAILETENTDYYDMAISALGIVGGPTEAVFLTTMFDDDDLEVSRKQSLIKALGKLKAVETWEKLRDLAEDEDENLYVRMYAAEAIGEMKKTESIDSLIDLFNSDDPNLRQYVLKGLSNYTDKKAQSVIVSGIKDDYWKVRQEAISIVIEQKLQVAAPYIRYRAEHDSENVIVYKSLEALGVLKEKEGIKLLIEIVSNEHKSDTLRAKSAEALLKNNITDGYKSVTEAATKTFEKDSYKDLRYAFGKLFIKYPAQNWESVCDKYLSDTDVATKGTGLEIYAANQYSSLTSLVKAISENDASETMKKKALNILEKDSNPELK